MNGYQGSANNGLTHFYHNDLENFLQEQQQTNYHSDIEQASTTISFDAFDSNDRHLDQSECPHHLYWQNKVIDKRIALAPHFLAAHHYSQQEQKNMRLFLAHSEKEVKHALEAGADPNSHDLFFARELLQVSTKFVGKRENALAAMKDAGLMIHFQQENGGSLLHECEWPSLSRLLISWGIDFNQTDAFGHTPLWVALSKEKYECAAELIRHGALLQKDVSTKASYSSIGYLKSILQKPLIWQSPAVITVIHFLIQHIHKDNWIDNSFRWMIATSLRYCVNMSARIPCWLEHIQKRFGLTEEDYMGEGILENMNCFVAGAYCYDAENPLTSAVLLHNTQILSNFIRYLKEKNNDFNINSWDSLGRTALHVAIKNHRFNLAECLLQHQADVLSTDNQGRKVEDYIFFIPHAGHSIHHSFRYSSAYQPDMILGLLLDYGLNPEDALKIKHQIPRVLTPTEKTLSEVEILLSEQVVREILSEIEKDVLLFSLFEQENPSNLHEDESKKQIKTKRKI